jgi:hypothetical protein
MGRAVSGMRIGRGNRSTWRKPARMPLCPPQIPHDLICRRDGKPVTNRLSSGRAIAQAVSRQLPTEAARVRAQLQLCVIYGGQNSTGTGFLRVLRFPLPILIPPTAPHSSSSSTIRGWYNRPISGRRTKWIQSHPHPRK